MNVLNHNSQSHNNYFNNPDKFVPPLSVKLQQAYDYVAKLLEVTGKYWARIDIAEMAKSISTTYFGARNRLRKLVSLGHLLTRHFNRSVSQTISMFALVFKRPTEEKAPLVLDPNCLNNRQQVDNICHESGDDELSKLIINSCTIEQYLSIAKAHGYECQERNRNQIVKNCYFLINGLGLTPDAVVRFFQKAKRCRFLQGHNNKGWKADLMWLSSIDRAKKFLSGKYVEYSRKVQEYKGSVPSFKEKFCEIARLGKPSIKKMIDFLMESGKLEVVEKAFGRIDFIYGSEFDFNKKLRLI